MLVGICDDSGRSRFRIRQSMRFHPPAATRTTLMMQTFMHTTSHTCRSGSRSRRSACSACGGGGGGGVA